MNLSQQLILEQEMMCLGTEKYLRDIDEKNDFDSIHTQIIIKKIIIPYSEYITGAHKEQVSDYVRHKTSLMNLFECETIENKIITAEQISLIVCKMIFNSIRHKPHKMVCLSQNIATNIQSNLSASYKLSDSAIFRSAVELVDLFCSSFPELVKYEYDFYDKKSKNKEYIIYPSQEYLDFVQDKIEAIAEITTVIYPMVCVPCDWDSTGHCGGFYSEELKTNIIKRKNLNDESGINETIAHGVNLIQSTPWVVNNEIRLIVKELNKTKPSSLKKLYPLPVPNDLDRPYDEELKYADMNDDQKKVHQQWSRQCSRNEKAREAKKSVEIARYASMKQADKFKAEPELFFPHDLDYRMRIYNKCMTGLNTQGSDVQKGLIKFGNARPVQTDNGIKWMCINLANLAGHDKLKLDERYAWTVNNEELLRDIAKDPIKCDLWHSWDKPIQGLAACLEYVKWLDDKERPVNMHVQLDGLCNGVQHLAAITKDEKAAPHVGLIWTPERGDVYQYVCDGVKDHISGMGGYADEWLTSGLMTRSLSKTPVMTRSYGAKLYGIKEGVQDFIEDNGKVDHFADYFKAGNWMGECIWESMDSSLGRPMAFMNWVQTCAEIMGKANKPLQWTSPVGGKCVQSPFTTKRNRIKTKINNKIVQYILQTPTNKINVSKMSSSSSPNVIHSCDASHLLLTVDKCYNDGITDFAMVHDSFGCHPDDAEQLLINAKKAWVEVYSKNWLEIWYEQWCNNLGTNDLPRPNEFVTIGSLDVKDVMKSDFFFA